MTAEDLGRAEKRSWCHKTGLSDGYFMVTLSELQLNQSYRCLANLNLYKTPDLPPEANSLVTQAAQNRQFRVEKLPTETLDPPINHQPYLYVRLEEDGYPGWLLVDDLERVAIAPAPYQPAVYDREDIAARLPEVIAFTQAAMNQPNEYLWGGTVAPNYDCSGLMQAAFQSVDIWIPRDAYQQEGFADPIEQAEVQAGDLVFFGPPEKATHVGLCLGNNEYIHSSGRDQGRNGIGIDQLSMEGDAVSRTYFEQLRGFGRVIHNYCSM